MKKIFSIFVICTISIVLNSCHNYRNIDEQCNGICGPMVIKEFEYKGHSYIEFKDDGTTGMTVLHNPDCKCFQNTSD